MINVDKLLNAVDALAAEIDWDDEEIRFLLVEFIREQSMTRPAILADLDAFLRQRIADDLSAQAVEDDFHDVDEDDDFLNDIAARHECVAVDDTDEEDDDFSDEDSDEDDDYEDDDLDFDDDEDDWDDDEDDEDDEDDDEEE